jgi:hypothetical protein
MIIMICIAVSELNENNNVNIEDIVNVNNINNSSKLEVYALSSGPAVLGQRLPLICQKQPLSEDSRSAGGGGWKLNNLKNENKDGYMKTFIIDYINIHNSNDLIKNMFDPTVPPGGRTNL